MGNKSLYLEDEGMEGRPRVKGLKENKEGEGRPGAPRCAKKGKGDVDD